MITIIQDITERKRTGEMLLTYTEQLRRSNQALEDFAFIASHDLQEPLRKIQAFGDSLQNSGDNLDERQRDYVKRMRGAAGRMEQMVDDLLALSRVTTEGQPFKPVDLSQVAEEVLSDLELQIRRTGGKVILSGLPVVEADPFQMRQLLQNLIGNALKYHRTGVPPVVKVYSLGTGDQGSGTSDQGLVTRNESSVLVSQSLVPDHQSLVTILVEDNGIGFDQSQVERIFQPFQRLVGKSQYEGNGIGLAIVHKIVERHNGKITAHSRRGQGSTFNVSLPVRHTRNEGGENSSR